MTAFRSSEARDLPVSIVNYVRRTSEAVVLANAQADDTYGDDAYIAACKPRSVMCVPVLKQGRLIGVLYLENNMVVRRVHARPDPRRADAFDRSRDFAGKRPR